MSKTNSIDLTEVKRVAELVSLTLSEHEAQQMTESLQKILAYVQKISELNVDNIPPTSHAVPLLTLWRADQIAPGLTTEKGLANAPERLGDGFGVPKIIE